MSLGDSQSWLVYCLKEYSDWVRAVCPNSLAGPPGTAAVAGAAGVVVVAAAAAAAPDDIS